MNRYLFPMALVVTLLVAANASAGGHQAPNGGEPAAVCPPPGCDPCCAPVLTVLQNARARLACLLTPPCRCPKPCDCCCPPPVLARIKAALRCPPACCPSPCCPPPVLARIKAALCCPPACCHVSCCGEAGQN